MFNAANFESSISESGQSIIIGRFQKTKMIKYTQPIYLSITLNEMFLGHKPTPLMHYLDHTTTFRPEFQLKLYMVT